MNFFKRATTSITRRPGKTVILMLLVFILGTVTAGAISVRGAIQNTDANLRARMQPIVSISEDWRAWQESEAVQRWNDIIADLSWEEQDEIFADPDHPLREYMPVQERLLPEHIRALGVSPYVYFYDFVISSSMQSFTVERYSQHNRWREDWEPEWFNLLGTSSTNMVQIDQGVINLIQGNQFSAGDLVPNTSNQSPIIVSEQWAIQNGLSIGSTFELYNIVQVVDPDGGNNWSWGPENFADENIWELVNVEFTIIGIFEIPADDDADNQDEWAEEQRINALYVPNWVLEDVNRRTNLANVAAAEDAGVEPNSWILDQMENEDDEFSGMHVIPLFILEDPRDMEDFRALAYETIPPYLRIDDMAGAFGDIESSMATMDTISFWVLWVSVGATLLILTLLITLFLRDRRYEMGVYLAIGEKKSKIISQILMEVVVTSLVGITLAVFAGHFISATMSQNMLLNELQASRETSNDPWSGGGMMEWSVFDQIGIPAQEMSITEMADAFQVRLGAETILLFYGVGIGAVVLSTMIPVIYVVTLKPKKVLM